MRVNRYPAKRFLGRYDPDVDAPPHSLCSTEATAYVPSRIGFQPNKFVQKLCLFAIELLAVANREID